MKRNLGFTLVELMIAASITAVIVVSIYSAFQSGIFSYQRIDAAADVFQSGRGILQRLERDLKNAYVYTPDDSRFSCGNAALEFFSVQDLYLQGKAFESVCKIRYEFGEKKLKRTLVYGEKILEASASGEPEELSSQVKEISFEFAYVPLDAKEAYAWQKDNWPTHENPQLNLREKKSIPLAVKIKLSLFEKAEGENTRDKEPASVEFTKVVPLALGEKPPA